jgi:hypothetical protein
MARLRRTNNVTVFTFEEKTLLTNFFMLLVEIDARLPKTAKAKTKKRAIKIKNKPCCILRQSFIPNSVFLHWGPHLKNEDGVRRLQLARQLFQMIDIN